MWNMNLKNICLILVVLFAFSSLIVVSANNLKSVEIISSDVGTESGQEISGVGSSFMIDNDGSISANNPKDVKNVTKFEGTVNINISSLNFQSKLYKMI